MSERDIERVRRNHEQELMALPNVIGVAIGERAGKPVIKVLVTRKLPRSELQPDGVVPEVVDGWETDVEEIGVVTAGAETKG